jgi:HD-GYP domain-containing protein (c-di-GMP phosphodiesterase class II)
MHIDRPELSDPAETDVLLRKLSNAESLLAEAQAGSQMSSLRSGPGGDAAGAELIEDVTGRRYLIIPIDEAPEPAVEAGCRQPGDTDRLRQLILSLQRDRQQVELERDALANEVGQTFEELYCLGRMATDLSGCDVLTDPGTLAERFLLSLCELTGAETITLVPPSSDSTPAGPSLIRAGRPTMAAEEILRIIRQRESSGSAEPFVFNRGSRLQWSAVQTTARNLIVLPLLHQQTRYGWLVAVNRLQPQAHPGAPVVDVSETEFGTREVGLLQTAATMLAGHARNVELFRAEESLRVSVIETIIEALDARDPYTCGHSRRVARYGVAIAEDLGLSPEQRERLYVTGLLHDVGKIGVPDAVLCKPGRLTDEEFDAIKKHPEIGHAILLPLRSLSYVLPGVLHHHERMDGKGYPHGLSGERIPLEARILAVADSFDAMTSSRSYRSAMPLERARGILQECAGTQWDAELIRIFLDNPASTEDRQADTPSPG